MASLHQGDIIKNKKIKHPSGDVLFFCRQFKNIRQNCKMKYIIL